MFLKSTKLKKSKTGDISFLEDLVTFFFFLQYIGNITHNTLILENILGIFFAQKHCTF